MGLIRTLIRTNPVTHFETTVSHTCSFRMLYNEIPMTKLRISLTSDLKLLNYQATANVQDLILHKIRVSL